MKISLLISILVSSFAISAQAGIQDEIDSMAIPSPEQRTSQRSYTDEVLAKIQLRKAPGSEGVEHNELADEPRPSIYSTATMIQKALDQAALLPMGARLAHFEKAAAAVLRVSKDRPMEMTVRMTINRAVDTMNTVLPIHSNDPAETARWAANFYTEAFQLAKRYANINKPLCSVLDPRSPLANFVQLADYGQDFARLMWQFSLSVSSDSSKAVMLLKTVGYLGWDLQLDLRARAQSIQEVLQDIYELQKEDSNTRNILSTIDGGHEPRGLVPALRSKVDLILKATPAAVRDADRYIQPIK